MDDFNGLLLQTNLIGGSWEKAGSGETIAVINPATAETLGNVPNCGADETKRAIDAASAAFGDWSRSNLSVCCTSCMMP